MSKIFSHIMKTLIIYLPFSIFGLLVLPAVVNLFMTIQRDETTKLTNLGFAIIAALSALCFSWNRSIITNVELQNFTRKQGERSLLVAILFLVCSGIKYTIVIIRSATFLNPKIVIGIQLAIFPFVAIMFQFLLGVTYWILFRVALRLWEEYDFTKKWPG